MFEQQLIQIIHQHLNNYLKFPKEIEKILVDQQKNNSLFLEVWRLLVCQHQQNQSVDLPDLIVFNIAKVKESNAPYDIEVAQRQDFWLAIQQKVDEIYQLYLMLKEWSANLNLNKYAKHYQSLFTLLILINLYQKKIDFWLIDDMFKVEENFKQQLNQILASKDLNTLQQKMHDIHQHTEMYFLDNSDSSKNEEEIKALEFTRPLGTELFNDLKHYLLEFADFSLIYIKHKYDVSSIKTVHYSKNSYTENVKDFLYHYDILSMNMSMNMSIGQNV